ncbi:dTDP-4-dehydrorhamnose reductase|uniref:dTDP-4-dehydrorhamnose reductase n=1 Tax=Brenneria salicis ATCC 15712 = DSM 30166 TaxID=714314 RepID=A0A366I3M1_9GAMM|nr:dTDP-4-dehydrorhamnose reductase [Brenneria salicis]NMN92145.1 dTDP-4-dehydrorhamnose reductase [Brenneria salicis ATCC 15712 = DSM 30166]RBP61135.1 dTDP-4-dehydrorhamnose reductase [Brenneria salicis ATCC 15712 = DSM 30166]RLM28712.1 dTDP-4-dehydrorhamnose reductase [Brenneria salicis ATCC 15712 = DSM 30166]
MKVLITGAHGQVGTRLVERLNGKAEILAVDRDVLDITNRDAVIQTVNKFHPDIIINAAAHTAVDKAEQEIAQSYKINCDGPLFLAEAAQSAGAAILHISTDYVFNGKSDVPYIESDTVDPQSVYGKSKQEGERAVAGACARHIILRTAWVFGEDGNNFVKTMLRLGRERDSLGIVADQFGGPTYAGDIADALIRIAEKVHSKEFSDWGIFHFSGMPYVSWFEFADKIFDAAVDKRVLDNKPNLSRLNTEDYPTPAARPSFSKLNCEKINQYFDIKPSDWIKALEDITLYR